jgi:hypothetical protein
VRSKQFLEASTFSFLKTIPENLKHTNYCPNCYDTEVAPALAQYNATLEQAETVYIFFKTQKKAPPVLKRAKEAVRVDDCSDRDETILRLAFFAAQDGYNALVEVDVTSVKVRNRAYQTSRWNGIGTPAQVDADRVERYFE